MAGEIDAPIRNAPEVPGGAASQDWQQQNADLPAAAIAGPRPAPARTDGRVSLICEIVDETGRPVPRAIGWITADGGSPETLEIGERDGVFLLLDRAPGDAAIELHAPGFVSQHGPLRLHPEPALQRQRLRLWPAWRLWVRAETETGEQLVTWLARLGNANSREFRPAFTAEREAPTGDRAAMDRASWRNEGGNFRAWSVGESEVPRDWDGSLDVAMAPPVFVAGWLGRLLLGHAELRGGEDRIEIRVDTAALLQRLASVELRVVDAMTRAPLPQARISLTPAWMGMGGRAPDADGRIRFENQVPSELDLEVTCPGYGDAYRSLVLAPGEQLDLGDLALTTLGSVRGRILDAIGAPAPDLAFRFFPTRGWSRPEDPRRSLTNTDSEGRFALQVGQDPLQILIADGAHGVLAVLWERGSAEAEERIIQLRPGVPARIFFTAPPRERRIVWLLDAAGLLLAEAHDTARKEWRHVLCPGAYLLRVEDLDRAHLATLDLHVPEGGGDLTINLP